VIQFTGIISEYEVSIKAMTEYLEQITQARPIHEVESEVLALALAVGHAAMKAFVERSGTGDAGLVHVDEAGNERKRHDTRPFTYRSIFGKVEIPRTYYYHPDHGGLCPLDAAFSLPERSYSYLLQNWMMRFGAKETYDNGCDDLTMLLGIKIPKRMAEAIVAEGAQDVAPFREQLAPPSEEGAILVIQADGKGIRMAKPKTDEPKGPKIRLTKGQKRNKKKMANVFTVYTINPVAEYSPDPIERKVYAFMGTKRAAFEKFAPEAEKRGYGRLKTLFLSDGDHDLADLQGEFFPEAEPCVDWIHVVEYLWKAAHVFHSEGSPEARAWVKEREDRLMANDVSTVIRGLKQSLTKGVRLKPSKKKTLEKVIGYLEGVRNRIPYEEWYAAGYPIGTGSVEGACRHLVEDRMGRAGMKWKIPGAQAVLDLRSVLENGEMDEFTEFRIRREHERLYGRPLIEGLAV
jgi:hypothetical protein